ncbi:MAG: HAD family hydrolase, partial [Actinobacteria bacterium]
MTTSLADEPKANASGFETPPTGLTSEQVKERIARGLTNEAKEQTSRSYGEILRANIFTRFNAILGVMLAVILIFGEIQDATFGVVLVANAAIGIFQEIRAKRKLDELAVVVAPTARVMRDSQRVDIPTEQIVLDDLLELRTGDQVPADGVVQATSGLEIDESLLTGESDPVDKTPGAEVLSGSFVVAGSGAVQVTRVGAEAYARKLALEARRFTLTRSELMDGINLILRIVQYALFPVSGLLLWRFLGSRDIDKAMTDVVAGVIGMVPEGLVLLTSVAFGIAAVTLARRNVLVQELPAVEVLARVDVVCLDKTGTLTEGDVVFDRIQPFIDEAVVKQALGALAHDENPNATLAAIGAGIPAPDGWSRTAAVPFSSARKWSAASFGSHGTWVIGAPEMVLPDPSVTARAEADELASQGRRVLMLACSDAALDGETLPQNLEPASLVLLSESIRPDAAETLRYFTEQGVTLKVISGDNPRTVSAVAREVGLAGAEHAVDARELPEDQEALADVLEQNAVFGRVTPQQKRAMVAALQSRGHVVAMTGDGVNDALALKDADIGVAMGSGAAATRAVAQLVLVDGKFSTMPGVVAEGRRVIANIERSANLFVTKTVYAVLIAIYVVAANWRFPWLPRHLTIVSTFTIGVPGFFLAIAPNTRRYVPGFIKRVLQFTIPAGIVAAAAVISTYGITRYGEDLTVREARTATTLVLIAVGLWVLAILARPFTVWRTSLLGAMVLAVGVILVIPGLRH